jgi:hypothetical protein
MQFLEPKHIKTVVGRDMSEAHATLRPDTAIARTYARLRIPVDRGPSRPYHIAKSIKLHPVTLKLEPLLTASHHRAIEKRDSC